MGFYGGWGDLSRGYRTQPTKNLKPPTKTYMLHTYVGFPGFCLGLVGWVGLRKDYSTQLSNHLHNLHKNLQKPNNYIM
jgi:hypothetical protein